MLLLAQTVLLATCQAQLWTNYDQLYRRDGQGTTYSTLNALSSNAYLLYFDICKSIVAVYPDEQPPSEVSEKSSSYSSSPSYTVLQVPTQVVDPLLPLLPLLAPLAALAMMGAAAILVANPVLLQLAVINNTGKRKRRR